MFVFKFLVRLPLLFFAWIILYVLNCCYFVHIEAELNIKIFKNNDI